MNINHDFLKTSCHSGHGKARLCGKGSLIFIPSAIILTGFVFSARNANSQLPELKPDILTYEPFIWPSEVPQGCPFKKSETFNELNSLV